MPKQLKLTHLVIILCLSVFAYSTNSIASQKDGLLKIHFFDIGQGDAIFVETPSGRQVLIDGGPGNEVLSRLGDTMPFFDKDLDLVVLTHPHYDHYNGLIEVLKRYKVSYILEAGKAVKDEGLSAGFSAWRNSVETEGAGKMDAVAGNEIDFGDGVKITVLHPIEYDEGKIPSDVHDDMVVAMLNYGSLDIILTGDMEQKIERRLIMQGYDLDSDVLKAGHHGSKTSSSEEFLSAVSPEVAIIQVGEKNRYGHPSPEVLERFEKYGIKSYRNDINGDIKIISDGEMFYVDYNR